MNILFVIPIFISVQGKYYEMPLGILYIATILKQHKHNVEIFDMNKYPEENTILEEYFNFVDIDYKKLNIEGILDSNQTCVGNSYLDEFNIIKRDKDSSKVFQNSAVIVMPSFYHSDIIHELENFEVANKQIFSVEID